MLPQLINPDRAREIMAAEQVDGLIACIPQNVYYFSGYWGLLMAADRFDAAFFAVLPADPAKPAALVLPSMELRRLVTQGGTWMPETFIFTRPDDEQDQIALDGVPYGGWPIRADATLTPLEKQWVDATRTHQYDTAGNARGALARALDAAGLTRSAVISDDERVPAWLAEAGLANVSCRADTNVFNRIRLVKTSTELDLMKHAAALNEAAMRDAAGAMIEGGDWDDVERTYNTSMAAGGGRGSYIMCGAGGPRQHTLTRGEPMFLDALGTYRQYHGDVGRCTVIGEPDALMRKRHAALCRGWEAVADLLRPGTRYSELAERAVDVVRKNGFPEFVYATPHSLGLEHTDDPKTVGGQQGMTSDTMLEPGVVLNVDMPFTEIGWGSVHIEDTVHITSDGFETLTSNNFDIIQN